jgi:hypothetical protein
VVIPVGWLAPVRCWDQHLLELLLSNRLYPTGLEFNSHQGYPHADGCVLILPARFWVGHYERINAALQRYDWVLMFRASDEEDCFDISLIEHPNLKWWVGYPRGDYGDARYFGAGFTPHFDDLPTDPPNKTLDVFLSGQRTHTRRQQAFEALEHVQRNQRIEATAGFTQGMEPEEYARCMTITKVAPAPSGVQSPDSFRVFEALQAHAVPVVDDVSPVFDSRGYWNRMFGDEIPFPVFQDYEDLNKLIDAELADWPASANRVAAWWMREKRSLAHRLVDDLRALGAL